QQFFRLDRLVGLENDRRHHFVLGQFRAHRKDRRGGNGRMPGKDLLDLEGGDVLPPAPDRILETVHKGEISLAVRYHTVTGVEPKIAPGLDRLLGHGEIAARKCEWLLGAQDKLSRDAGWQRIILLIDYPRRKPRSQASHTPGTLIAHTVADHEVGFGGPIAV